MTSKRKAVIGVAGIFLVLGITLYILSTSQKSKESFEGILDIQPVAQIPQISQEPIVIPQQMPRMSQEPIVIPQQMPRMSQEPIVIPQQIPRMSQEPIVIPQQIPRMSQEQEIMPQLPEQRSVADPKQLERFRVILQRVIQELRNMPIRDEMSKQLEAHANRQQQMVQDMLRCNKIQASMTTDAMVDSIQKYESYLKRNAQRRSPVSNAIREPIVANRKPVLTQAQPIEVIPIELHIKELERLAKAVNLFLDMNNQGRIPDTEMNKGLVTTANIWRREAPRMIGYFQANPALPVKPLFHREVIETTNKLNAGVQNALMA
jgi:hypothetical protein